MFNLICLSRNRCVIFQIQQYLHTLFPIHSNKIFSYDGKEWYRRKSQIARTRFSWWSIIYYIIYRVRVHSYSIHPFDLNSTVNHGEIVSINSLSFVMKCLLAEMRCIVWCAMSNKVQFHHQTTCAKNKSIDQVHIKVTDRRIQEGMSKTNINRPLILINGYYRAEIHDIQQQLLGVSEPVLGYV